jgi:H+-transporting ATPase
MKVAVTSGGIPTRTVRAPDRAFTVQTTPSKSEGEPTPEKPASAKPPDIATASVPDTLAALHVNPGNGLTHVEVDVRRKEHGFNEVAEKKGHPVPS